MITIFQLRAARSGIGITLKDLGEVTNISYATLAKIEKKNICDIPKIRKTTLEKIIQFYNGCGVEFINDNTIKINFKSF